MEEVKKPEDNVQININLDSSTHDDNLPVATIPFKEQLKLVMQYKRAVWAGECLHYDSSPRDLTVTEKPSRARQPPS